MKKFDLNDLPKKIPFQTPDGYFDNLPQRVQKKLHARKAGRRFADFLPMLLWGKKLALPVLLLAACIFGYRSFIKKDVLSDVTSETALAGITGEDLMGVFLYEDYSADEMADMSGITTEQLDDLSQLDEEAVYEYLGSEVDLEDL